MLGGVQVGDDGIVVGDDGIVVTDGTETNAATCCCGGSACIVCTDIISATIRYTGVQTDCCVESPSSGWAHLDGTLNGRDFTLFPGPIPTTPDCGDSYNHVDIIANYYNDDTCTGDPVQEPTPYDTWLIWDGTNEEWALYTIDVAGNNPAFLSRVSAPATGDGCLTFPTTFNNEYTACGDVIEFFTGAVGYNGSATVTWNLP